MKVILSLIAVCLVMITAKLYLPEASAEVEGKSYKEYVMDKEFAQAVVVIVEQRCMSPFQQLYANGMFVDKPQIRIGCYDSDLVKQE